jgi:hypothetical protein
MKTLMRISGLIVDCLQQLTECLLQVSETLQHVKMWHGKLEFAQPIIATRLLRLTEHAARTVLNGFGAILKGLGGKGEQLIKQDALLRMQTLLDGSFNGDEHGSVLLDLVAGDDVQQMHTLYKNTGKPCTLTSCSCAIQLKRFVAKPSRTLGLNWTRQLPFSRLDHLLALPT